MTYRVVVRTLGTFDQEHAYEQWPCRSAAAQQASILDEVDASQKRAPATRPGPGRGIRKQ